MSPDVLTGGRWVLDRYVLRWVAEDEPAPVDELPAPRCVECERKEWRPLRRGLCPACYTRSRNRDRKKPPTERPCVWCEAEFLPHDPRQIHCSASCARDRARARQQERERAA